ncbi:MAG: MFS transporter [Oscillospiraceae bacterium]
MLNIILLGLVSFFSDFSTEMVYPLIPLYLTSAFGATPALVGVIEGAAESVASLLKVFSGYISDKYKNKKPLAFLGYATGLIYKLALLVAGSWGGILAARVIDRIGKGIRTAPRDVLVAESADKNSMGGSFGVHKALDMAGSAAGILAAYLLMTAARGAALDYKRMFLLSLIPAAIGLVCMLFVKEQKTPHETKERVAFWKNWGLVDGNFKLYLLAAFVFTLGNSSNSFLLLRAKSAGYTDTNVVLLYLAYNLTAAVLSIPFGRLSDKIGRKKLLIGGYLAFSAVYFGFAFAKSASTFVVIFILYGVYSAMTAGVERAMIAEIAPKELRGTLLGLQSTVVGVALLPASVIAGLLWDWLGSAAPFLFGSVMSLAAAMLLLCFFGRRKAVEA